MNYFAQGIMQGGQIGADAYRERQRRGHDEKLRTADAALRRELADKALEERAARERERRATRELELDAAAKALAEERQRAENDPVNRLQRAKAQLELDHLGKPLPAAPPTAKVTRKLPGDATASYDMPLTDLERSFGPALPPPPVAAPPPSARITQAFGEDGRSRAEFDVPLGEAKRMAGAAGYKSPFADEIATLGSRIAEHESEIESGDKRTGFLGLGGSRQSDMDKAKRQRRRLQALEIQDALARGAIDEAEADRRANQILSAP